MSALILLLKIGIMLVRIVIKYLIHLVRKEIAILKLSERQQKALVWLICWQHSAVRGLGTGICSGYLKECPLHSSRFTYVALTCVYFCPFPSANMFCLENLFRDVISLVVEFYYCVENCFYLLIILYVFHIIFIHNTKLK